METRTKARDVTWGELGRPESAAAWNAVAPALAATLRGASAELSVEMLERIRVELPELLPTPDEAEINRASNEANLRLIADLIEAGADPGAARLPAPTRAYAEFGADRDTPMAGLLRAYRIGHSFAWEVILASIVELVEEGELSVAVGLFSTWLHAYIDAVICQAEDVYAAERERWLRSSSALRIELIKSILDGSAVEPGSASARLGYEIDRHHLAVIAWIEEPGAGGELLAEAEAVIAAAAEELGASAPLMHPLGLSAAAGWIGSREPLEADAIRAEAVGDRRVLLAVGDSGSGLDGFRRSHLEAVEARRVASAETSGASLTRYRDVALRALGTVDRPQARQFVHSRLEDLLDPDRGSVRHGETLVAFLDEGGSHGRAAVRLGVHENTVRYRIRQVEDLIGSPVRSDDLELRVALELAGDVGAD